MIEKTAALDLACHFVDTCYPDYLQDHHNRDNELLISAWAGQSTYEIASDLIRQAWCDEKLPVDIDYDQLSYVIRTELDKYPDNCVSISPHHYLANSKDIDIDIDIWVYCYLSW